jgi:hypothetical protein
MIVDKSQMGMTFDHPRVSRAHQEVALREAGAQWIIHVGKLPKTWMEAVKAAREGDRVFIYAAPMVPAPRKVAEMSAAAQWSSFLADVISAKAELIEVCTGRSSKNLKQRRAMNEETMRLLQSGGKRLPASGRGAGRPAKTFSEDQWKQAYTAWFSRDYATNPAAERHMPAGFTVTMARRKWGPSGRPWKKRRGSRSTN